MEAGTVILLTLGAFFASSVLIPPWLVYVTLVNTSCDKAQHILEQKSESLAQEAKALEEDLIELLGSPSDSPSQRSFYHERKLQVLKKSEHYKFLAKKVFLEKRISNSDRDWAAICLTITPAAIPFLSYHFFSYLSKCLTNGPSNFLARRMVHQLESNQNA